MKIRTIFIPLLICTGIFGFTEGQVDFVNNLGSTVYTFFAAAGLPSEYADATPEKYKNEIINDVRKTCNRSGEAGVLTMATKIQNTTKCILSLDESIKLEYSRITKGRKSAPQDFIDTLCPHLSDLESCLNDFRKDNPCLGLAELEAFDMYRDGVMTQLRFKCKNNGENYKMITSENFTACLEERYAESAKCIEEYTGDMLRNDSSEVNSPSDPQELPWSLPEKEYCIKLEKFQECHLNVLQQCEEPAFTKEVKDLNNEILFVYRCTNSVTSQSSPVSLIVLLIVTAFKALCF